MAQITGGPHRGHAAGDTDLEKQASQLASDVKYKVKKKLSGATHMNPAQVAAAYQAQLSASVKAGTPNAVVALAKKKLMGANNPAVRKEDFDNGKELALESVANALYSVFVEKKEIDINALKEAYSKINKKGERLYHIIVTDKKTGNTYTRDATREKIAELRANPNIASVEMSERQLDSENERSQGAKTAAVKSGKGLDAVGKEDDDPNNNGIKNDKSDKYIMKRRAAIGAAIAGRGTQKEEFIGEGESENLNPQGGGKKIKPMGPNEKNTVVIGPSYGKQKGLYAHHEMEGPFIAEKSLSQGQQKFLEMIQERKMTKDEKAKEEKIGKKTKKKALPAMQAEYGNKKGEQVYYAWKRKQAMKEAAECEMDEKPKSKDKKDVHSIDDSRQTKTAASLMRSKLASAGLRMSYEPEGEVIDESERREIDQERFGVGGRPGERRPERPANAPTGPKKPASKVDAVALVLQQTRDKYGANAVTGGTRIRKPKPKA